MSAHLRHWHEAYLAALRECPVIQHGCNAAGVDRTTVWRHRQDDEAFAQAEKEAMDAGVDRAEREAFSRAIDGWREPVFYQGEQCGEVLKKSDAMLSLILKGRRKAVYAERTELTGADGAPLDAADDTARAARLAALLALAQARKDADDLA